VDVQAESASVGFTPRAQPERNMLN